MFDGNVFRYFPLKHLGGSFQPIRSRIAYLGISRFLYGDGSDCCKECLQRWRGMLRNSRGAEVIKELPTLRDSGDSTLGDDFEGEVDYLTANQ